MDTTVTISIITSKKLDKLVKANSCTKKDFLFAALSYFERYGINPLTHESPAQEMQTLIKRLNSVIAFIRQNEKEILRPACEALFSTDERIRINLDNLVSKKDLSSINDRFHLITKDLKEIQTEMNNIGLKQEDSFKLMIQALDEKNRSGLSDKVKNIFGR